MLRAQGAQPSQIRRVVVAEAMLLCAAAVPLGLAMAALVAKTVVGMAAKTLSTQALNVNTVEEARTLLVSSTSIPWATLAAAAGCGVAFAIVSALGPARMAGCVSPTAALTGFRGAGGAGPKLARTSRPSMKVRSISTQLARQNLRRTLRRTALTVAARACRAALMSLSAFAIPTLASGPDQPPPGGVTRS